MQNNTGEVKNSTCRVYGKNSEDTEDEFGRFITTSWVSNNRIWFPHHALLKNKHVDRIRFETPTIDSGWINPEKCGILKLGDNMESFISYPIPNVSSSGSKLKSASFAKNKDVHQGRKTWTAFYSIRGRDSNGVKTSDFDSLVTASGELIAVNSKFATYDFSTEDGNCGAPIYINGTNKLVGIHIYGSSGGNTCVRFTEDIIVRMGLPQEPYTLN
jgi:hypothetical protein